MNTDLITILNIIGVIAFAISGALKGMKSQLDILGVIVLGIITALGGGIIRDILMNVTPSSLKNERDMYFAIAASLLTYFAGRRIHNLTDIIRIFDAAGLAVFTVIGAEIGVSGGLGYLG
ncbi:MAG TPA: TRIC cation channel family protein, partial [Spirochaetota bacterium]|nr:TRIC cation channel family protein [Spirochaetota bacterium]